MKTITLILLFSIISCADDNNKRSKRQDGIPDTPLPPPTTANPLTQSSCEANGGLYGSLYGIAGIASTDYFLDHSTQNTVEVSPRTQAATNELGKIVPENHGGGRVTACLRGEFHDASVSGRGVMYTDSITY